MAKKKPAQQRQLLTKKRLASILAIFSLIFASTVAAIFLFSDTPFSLKAAIIDQLSEEYPNPTFVENATAVLSARNFTVNYYNSSLNVEFFKGLAKKDFGIIILRVHSALRNSTVNQNNSIVDLFTSERYFYNDHRSEQERGLLVPGEYFYRPGEYYFAVTNRFVDDLEGRFPKSIIIAMGCWSLKPQCEEMAEAFVNKGAEAYVGWTEEVLPHDTDNETLRLLDMLFNRNFSLGYALSQTDSHSYQKSGQTITTWMRLFPQEAENLTISELLGQTQRPFNAKVVVVGPALFTSCFMCLACKIRRFETLSSQIGLSVV